MRKSFKIIFFFLFLSFSNILFAEISSNIIVKVENKIITNFQLKNKILSSLILANQTINQKNIEKIKKNSLNSLIQDKLKEIEIEKYNIKVNKNNLNNYLNSISSGNIQGLKNSFSNYEVDFETFSKSIETQLNWQSLIYKIYSKIINVNEMTIQNDLEQILIQKSKLETYRLAEIELSLENVSDKNRILFLQNEIDKIGFESAAIKYSISNSSINKGDIGWINKESLSKEIYKLVSKMKVGEITKPIISEDKVIFFKLTDKKITNTKKLDIDQLKAELIKQKKNELFNLYSRNHLSKLKNSSLIEFNEK
tara:strand:- start:216 stop:1145 length:930 start_codon:yes stop_codon:yes gene_type:complete